MCVVPTLAHSGSQGTEAAWTRLVYILKRVQHVSCRQRSPEVFPQRSRQANGAACSVVSKLSYRELLPYPTLTTLIHPSCVLAPPVSWVDASQVHVRFLNRLQWQPFLLSLFLTESRFRFTAEKSEGSRDFSHIKTSHTTSSMIRSTPKGKCLRADGPARHTVTTNLH